MVHRKGTAIRALSGTIASAKCPPRGAANVRPKATTVPRPPRFIQPGQPLHIVQRGNNRCAIFLDEHEFAFYLRLVARVAPRVRCKLHAFVLMTNHVHLLVTPADAAGPAGLMKSVSEEYARYFNHSHERTGTLWEGRYRSSAIDSPNYFFACSRYIELNPLRAGLSGHPADYPWSSFAQNAGAAPKGIVAEHPLYSELGRSEPARRAAYREMFDQPMEQAAVDAIRYVLWHRAKPRGRTAYNRRLEDAQRILRGA